jgi:hypothetical protein
MFVVLSHKSLFFNCIHVVPFPIKYARNIEVFMAAAGYFGTYSFK